MSFSLHPGAEQDIADALDFYIEQAGVTVAQRFLDEFERIVRLLSQNPEIGTTTSKGRREFPLRVFPYSVVYRNLEPGIHIVIVRHQHRRPGYGRSRR